MKIEIITSLAAITDTDGHPLEVWKMRSIPADVAALLSLTGKELVAMICNDPYSNRRPRYEDREGGKGWRETSEIEKFHIAVQRLFGSVNSGGLKPDEKLNMKCVWAVINYAKINRRSVIEAKPHCTAKSELEILEAAL